MTTQAQRVAIFSPDPTRVIHAEFPQLGYWDVPQPDSLDNSANPIWLVQNSGPRLEVLTGCESVTLESLEFLYLVWDCDRWRVAQAVYIEAEFAIVFKR